MKAVLYQNKILIPHPQDEQAKWIVRRRLEGKDFKVYEAEHYHVSPTAAEQAAWEALHGPPKIGFYAVLTKSQLGTFLGIVDPELTQLFEGKRRSLDGTLCLHKIKETEDWYIALPPAKKNLVYPMVYLDPNQYPNLKTIYDYLDDNQALWVEPIA
jgi:hypothetical protein